jgi:ubiquitin-like domain-containing CTD phosphatase 1
MLDWMELINHTQVLMNEDLLVEPVYYMEFLIELTFIPTGKLATDDCLLSNLNLKVGMKIMMMGSLEREYEAVDVPPEERPDVNNDLDIPDDDNEPLENREIYLNKVVRRVKEYNVNILNAPREGKKLLVLDIDYTLFDHRSPAESGAELMRPFLHEFLTAAYSVR